MGSLVGVQRVGFALQAAGGPVGAVNLQDVYPLVAQDSGELGSVRPCSLDSYSRHCAVVVDEVNDLPVAGSRGQKFLVRQGFAVFIIFFAAGRRLTPRPCPIRHRTVLPPPFRCLGVHWLGGVREPYPRLHRNAGFFVGFSCMYSSHLCGSPLIWFQSLAPVRRRAA